MMFATLDDLEASVELIVFGNALAASEEALTTDSIVLVKGRVDHKDRDKTCLIVQQVERFQATPEKVREAQLKATAPPPSALCLQLDATALPYSALSDLRELLEAFPGESEVVIDLRTSSGQRQVKLGNGFRVAPSAALYAELLSLLGRALLSEDAAAEERASMAASGV